MSEARVEALAEWYSLSAQEKREKGLPDPAAVAALLGVSAGTVRKAQSDKRVTAKVRERLDQELLYMVVELRPVLRSLAMDAEEKADTRLKAIRTVEELAGNLKKAAGATVNVVNPVTVLDDEMSDEEFMTRFREAARKRGEEE